jgi:hypothetical protein
MKAHIGGFTLLRDHAQVTLTHALGSPERPQESVLEHRLLAGGDVSNLDRVINVGDHRNAFGR